MRRTTLCLAAFAFSFLPALALGQGSPPIPAPPGGQPSPPIPDDANARAEWEYVKDNQKIGRFTLAQMRQFLVNGTIGADTYVWRPGMANWQRAQEVAELREIARPGTGTGEGTEAALRDRHKAHMIGTWGFQRQINNAYGIANFQSTLTFSAEGRYFGTETQTYAGLVSRQPRAGTWAVTPVNDTGFALSMTEDNGGNRTIDIRIVDRNTIYNSSDRITVQRMR